MPDSVIMPSSTPLRSLAEKHCQACRGGSALQTSAVEEGLKALPGWEPAEGAIAKSYTFKNYYTTIAFVNAIAWVSHREDHHADLEVGYNRCRVRYSTHSVGGISENDLICAAKVEQLHATAPD